MCLLVKSWGLTFAYTVFSLGTGMTWWLWTHCVLLSWMGHTSQLQRQIRKLLMWTDNRNSTQIPQPRRLQPWSWSWGLGVRCVHLIVPFSHLLSLTIGLCISSHEEVGFFSPPLESWGGQEKWQRGAGPALRSYSLPLSRNQVDESGAAHWGKEDHRRQKMHHSSGHIPNLPSPSQPAADHRHKTELRDNHKNCPVEPTGLFEATKFWGGLSLYQS